MTADNAGNERQVAQLINCLGLGGTERQLVQSLRQLERTEWRSSVMCLQKTGELLDELNTLGIEPIEFHLRGSLVKLNTLRQVLRMSRHVRATNATLVHSHDFYSNILGPNVAQVAGVPCVVSRRDLGAWLGPWRRRALTVATKRADHVLCNAHAIRDSLIRDENIAPERITVVPNGLDLTAFDESTRKTESLLGMFDDSTWRIALVANMKHRLKGHSTFLEAAQRVARLVPTARFLLVGDGEHRAELERLAATLGLQSRVIFLGRRNDVPAILARSHAVICSSTSEGLSNAIMEGMAARLPIVATAVGGNTELVRDGRTGFLVRPRDSEAMAARIIELANSTLLAQGMGNAGRRRIEEEFSANVLGKRLQGLYASLTKSEGSHRRAA